MPILGGKRSTHFLSFFCSACDDGGGGHRPLQKATPMSLFALHVLARSHKRGKCKSPSGRTQNPPKTLAKISYHQRRPFWLVQSEGRGRGARLQRRGRNDVWNGAGRRGGDLGVSGFAPVRVHAGASMPKLQKSQSQRLKSQSNRAI